MTLGDFLKVCHKEDYIGILNMGAVTIDRKYKSSKRFEVYPTKQHYMKIGNIPYGRIRYFLDFEVEMINHTDKGYFVRIRSERDKQDTKNWKLARAIKAEFKTERR